MRILHLANGRLYGGVERMLATLAESHALLQRVTFEFGVCHEGRLERELQARGAEVHSLGNVRLSRPATVLSARRRLRALIEARQYRVVVCHAPWTQALFGSVVRGCGAGLVLWQHDKATGRTFLERRVRRAAAAFVICNSQWTATSTETIQPGVARRVVYCPVSKPVARSSRAAIRRALGACEADVVILAASRLEPWKGHRTLLEALAQRPNRRWVLWIAGGAQRRHEAAYLRQIEGACREYGIAERVRFLGEREDVPDLLAAADLLAQANSEPEPFGIVFAEALLAGLPVVTSRMGGAPEIVSESCGRLVPAGDTASLAAALSELIDDGAVRSALGEAGPAHAGARCDPRVVLPMVEEILLSVGAGAAA